MTEGHIIEENADFVFQTVPSLLELIPSTGGNPGIIYAQIWVGSMKRAQNEGWKRIQGAKVYTILGPDGRADMELLARGKAILGQDTSSGARRCYIDTEVYKLTGHTEPKKENPSGSTRTPKQSQHSQATAQPQVQATGNPSVR